MSARAPARGGRGAHLVVGAPPLHGGEEGVERRLRKGGQQVFRLEPRDEARLAVPVAARVRAPLAARAVLLHEQIAERAHHVHERVHKVLASQPRQR